MVVLKNTHWDSGEQKHFHSKFLSGFSRVNGVSSIFEVEMVLSYMPRSKGDVGSQGKPVSSHCIACSGTTSRCLIRTLKTAMKVVYITYYLIKRFIWINGNSANRKDLLAATGLVILRKWDSNLGFFGAYDLHFKWMTSQNNRAPVLSYGKLCTLCQSHLWFQTRATVRKRSIRSKAAILCHMWTWNLKKKK